MIAPLSLQQRDRLVRFLEIARTTAHEGEAVNALTFANKQVRAAGISWGDLIGPRLSYTPPPPPPHHRSEPRRPSEPPPDWRETVRRCRAQPQRLSAWEKEFLGGLGHFPRLSPKQRARLREIAERLGVP